MGDALGCGENAQEDKFHDDALARLSMDILIHVLQNLDAKDILRVRKANRRMRRVTKFKSVWLTVLLRTCERHGIFKPTFPLDNMSTLDLENALTSPFKFLHSIKRIDLEDSPVPYHTSLLRFHSGSGSTGKNAGYDVKTLHLVPGGRFLLTSGRFFCLWDLGYSANLAPKPFPFSEPLHLDSAAFGAIVPGAGANSLILGTIQRNELIPQHYTIAVHTIDVTEARRPAFRLSSALHLTLATGSVRMYHLSATIAVLWSYPFIVVWNWASGVACKWIVDKLAGIQPNAFVSDKSIFLWDDRNMRIWDLPAQDELVPLADGEVVVITNRPKASMQNFSDEGFIISSRSPWQRSFPDQHICLLYPGMPYIRLFSVRTPAAQRDPFLPGSYLVPTGESDNEYGPGCREWVGNGVSSLSQCDDELVLCSRSGGDQCALVVVVLKAPTTASLDEIAPFSRALTPVGAVATTWSSYQFDFCPFSGRAVYFTPSGDVMVSDYVLPSQES